MPAIPYDLLSLSLCNERLFLSRARARAAHSVRRTPSAASRMWRYIALRLHESEFRNIKFSRAAPAFSCILIYRCTEQRSSIVISITFRNASWRSDPHVTDPCARDRRVNIVARNYTRCSSRAAAADGLVERETCLDSLIYHILKRCAPRRFFAPPIDCNARARDCCKNSILVVYKND